MVIQLKQAYKSLQPFISEDLPNFVVVTGKNGSGKTQLIQLLSPKKADDRNKVDYISLTPQIKRIQIEGISKNRTATVSFEVLKKKIQPLVDIFQKFIKQQLVVIDYCIENQFDPFGENFERTWHERHSASAERALKLNSVPDVPPLSTAPAVSSYVKNIYKLENKKLIRLLTDIRENTQKKVVEITKRDIFEFPLQDEFADSEDLFKSEIEFVFYNYALKRHKNRERYFHKKENGDINNSVSDEEFKKNNIPPWEIINEFLLEHGVDFYFQEISKTDFRPDESIETILIKRSVNRRVPITDLSSGEKIIVGLLLLLFTAKHYNKKLKFPELLVLDEPDANLHPEMTMLLLDVLEKTFVGKLGMKVIITTHSPSTIALASDQSIFQLKNEVESGLKKISKDSALEILTSFIPTLTINYKSQKQVFVESPTDVLYYQTVFNKYSQANSLNSKLYFISLVAGKGNCDSVLKIVPELRDYGNQTSYGIIDWDDRNKETGYVFVHGLEERYTIENFVLDPLYMLALFIELRFTAIMSDIGVDKTYNQYNIGNEPVEILNKWVQVFLSKLPKKLGGRTDGESVVHYHNEKSVTIPTWYLRCKGHHLLADINRAFPFLREKFSTDVKLLDALTIIAGKCYPLTPTSSIDLFEEINAN